MIRLYKENKPKFFKIMMIFWLIMLVLGFILKWTLISKLMCLSLAASSYLFIGTSKKDAEWIAKYGDPDEYEKKMKALEKAAAEAKKAENAQVAVVEATETAEEVTAESAEAETSEEASEEATESTPEENE